MNLSDLNPKLLSQLESILTTADQEQADMISRFEQGTQTLLGIGEFYMRTLLEIAGETQYVEPIRDRLPELGELLGRHLISLSKAPSNPDTDVQFVALGFATMMVLINPGCGTITGLATAYMMGRRSARE